MDLPRGSVVKEPTCNAGDVGETGSNTWSGRSAGVGNGNPSILVWSIPQTEDPGGLQSMG